MRVLQVIDGFPPELCGGAQRFCFGLSNWLTAVGVDVQVATPSDASRAASPKRWPLNRVKSKYLRKLLFDYFSPWNARRLEQIMAEFQPDIVHGHNIYGISSQLLHVASQRVPTVVTLHDYWPVDLFSPKVSNRQLRYPRRQTLLAPWVRLHRAIHRRHLGGVKLVSPSRYLARRLSEVSGYQGVLVIPNAIDVPTETTRYEPRILFVGRLVAEKGLHAMVQPLDEVARRAKWSVDIVGDGPLRRKLEHGRSGLQFHGSADPAPFYRAASILIVPSLWPENQPYVILEGMSYGLAVLVSNVGGIPELVEDGVTGALFEPGDAGAFADSLGRLTANRSVLVEMGRRARDHIAAGFTWEEVGERYLQLYQELRGGGYGSPPQMVRSCERREIGAP